MEIRHLTIGDEHVFARVAAGVFDHDVSPELVGEFLADPRHHMVGAIDADRLVGFASAIHYIHPDKPAQLFVNEVGVSPNWQGQGVAGELMTALIGVAKIHGCTSVWVLTDEANTRANSLYDSVERISDVRAVTKSPAVMYEFELDAGP